MVLAPKLTHIWVSEWSHADGTFKCKNCGKEQKECDGDIKIGRL